MSLEVPGKASTTSNKTIYEILQARLSIAFSYMWLTFQPIQRWFNGDVAPNWLLKIINMILQERTKLKHQVIHIL